MPSIKSLFSNYCNQLVTTILSFSEVMPSYSCYIEKKLIYIAITAPSGYQPFLYTKCTQVNIKSSYNVRSVSNTKYTFLPRLISL